MSYSAYTTLFFGWCTDDIFKLLQCLLPNENYESLEDMYENRNVLNQQISNALNDIVDKPCTLKFDRFEYEADYQDLYYFYFDNDNDLSDGCYDNIIGEEIEVTYCSRPSINFLTIHQLNEFMNMAAIIQKKINFDVEPRLFSLVRLAQS